MRNNGKPCFYSINQPSEINVNCVGLFIHIKYCLHVNLSKLIELTTCIHVRESEITGRGHALTFSVYSK